MISSDISFFYDVKIVILKKEKKTKKMMYSDIIFIFFWPFENDVR